MLLKRRVPAITPRATIKPGYEHLDGSALAMLGWLNRVGVDYVLVGPVAEALRGRPDARGSVAIVPAPYVRNYERLSRALTAVGARQRAEHAAPGEPATLPVKLTAEKLGRGQRWLLRCGQYDLDIEPPIGGVDGAGVSGYQELLYEATRAEPADGIAVEVASPEDIEQHGHAARTGTATAIRITRRTERPVDAVAAAGESAARSVSAP